MRSLSFAVLSVAGLLYSTSVSFAFTSRPTEQQPTTTGPSNPAFDANRAPAPSTGAPKTASPAAGGAPVRTESKGVGAMKGEK